MYPRSLAFSFAAAVLASGSAPPVASAESIDAVEIVAEVPAAPRWVSGVPMRPEARTAWQTRIDARLDALRQAPVNPSTLETSVRRAATLRRLITDMGDNTAVGIAVKDLRTGNIVFEHNGDQLLNPASNHKLLTATAAVTLLGDDYRFETAVFRDGATLVLKGHGDPSLQVEDLERLAAQVDPTGLERIVVDDSVFSARRFGPGYDEDGPGFSYMAPSGALSLQYNTVVVAVTPDGSADGISVQLDPPCAHLVVERGRHHGPLEVTTVARGQQTVVHVDGRPHARTEVRRRITDPGRFTASVFARALGTPELPVELGEMPSGAIPVAVHRSAPLPAVLGSALKFSNNFTTEQVLRTLGHRTAGEPGDWNNGTAVLREFWAASGRDPEALSFENGSGLSRRGRVTPRALVDLVSLWIEHERSRAVISALPVAGREGTLKRRLRRSDGRVRAKTGTLHDSTGLTGIVTDNDGRPQFAFSVLVQTEQVGKAKRFQDRVVMALL